MKNFIISEQQLVILGNYIASKPFAEVENYVHMLRTLPELDSPINNVRSLYPDEDHPTPA